MATLVQSMPRESLGAFIKKDTNQARSVIKSDDAVDQMRDRTYDELVQYMETDLTAIPACIHLMFVARNLERIADHTTNIAEDIVFLVEGTDVRRYAEVLK